MSVWRTSSKHWYAHIAVGRESLCDLGLVAPLTTKAKVAQQHCPACLELAALASPKYELKILLSSEEEE